MVCSACARAAHQEVDLLEHHLRQDGITGQSELTRDMALKRTNHPARAKRDTVDHMNKVRSVERLHHCEAIELGAQLVERHEQPAPNIMS